MIVFKSVDAQSWMLRSCGEFGIKTIEIGNILDLSSIQNAPIR